MPSGPPLSLWSSPVEAARALELTLLWSGVGDTRQTAACDWESRMCTSAITAAGLTLTDSGGISRLREIKLSEADRAIKLFASAGQDRYGKCAE